MLEHVSRLIERAEGALYALADRGASLRRRMYAFQARRHHWTDERMDFFRQTISLDIVPERMPLIESLCAGKDVLHVGCADWPIFRPETNLHLQLAHVTKSLAGLDPNEPGLEALREHHPGAYYTRPQDVDGRFDVLLVPEVIEHVPNAGDFLRDLDGLHFSEVLITAPNAIFRQSCPWWSETYRVGTTLTEFVHPDHKCYYSPYTLCNVIEQLTPWEVTRVGLTTRETSVFVHARKAAVR